MTRSIRLLGRPSIEVDGLPAAGPRGRKAWAVLAFLMLAEHAPSRRRLASLLFQSADDPLGALRWTLADLRRALGGGDTVTGDPVRLELPVGTVVDLQNLRGKCTGWLDPRETPDELLAGLSFDGCEAFESWLIVERARIAAAVQAVLREEGLASLSAGKPREAQRQAARLVELNPFEEAYQVLLVRALAMSGERRAAYAAATKAAELWRRELGVEPSPALRDAAFATAGAPTAPASVGIAGARAQLEAGKAALAAGAVDAGLDCLRRCVDEMRFHEEGALLVAALCELGGALVHSVRGRDEEGAAVLHEAVERAARVDDLCAAHACRELGFIDVQAGRRERAGVWLAKAKEHAMVCGDDAELAAIAGVEGMSLSDQARYPEALDALNESVERALSCGNLRQAGWSASIAGRLHLLRGDYGEAERSLDASLEWVRSERWLAFLPWPESFRAEVAASTGHEKQAEECLMGAFALACQLGDPCWEGVTARGLGLLQAGRDPERGLSTLLDARTRCTRWPDAYQWVHGYVLDAICTVAVASGSSEATGAADSLLDLAARTDMRELVARAQLHRAALGVPGAGLAGALAGADVDNALLRIVSRRHDAQS